MAYLTPEQVNEGRNDGTLAPGSSANVVVMEYAPFTSKKGKTIPKHIVKDAESGTVYELVGYAFHDAIGQLNQDAIIPEQTVLHVKCLDNGTQYPDFEVTLVGAAQATADSGEKIPF